MNRTAILLVSSLLALVALGGCSSDCNLACAEASECVQIAPGPFGDLAAGNNIDVCTNLCENAIDETVTARYFDEGVGAVVEEPLDITEDKVADCAACLDEATCGAIKDASCSGLDSCAFIPGVDIGALRPPLQPEGG